MKHQPENIPSLADIKKAADRIKPYAHKTPILTCSSLDKLAGATIYFKCENFQKVGAFKFRGAVNAVMSLSDEEVSSGVVTHSSGNHAQALALAAKYRKIRATIVMPENAPKVKVNAVREYGAEILFCEPTLKARESTLQQLMAETGAKLIHPYNDLRIIAGQATCALELLEQIEKLDVIIAPIGGGGLLSGTATTVHYLAPHIKVIGAEPEKADDAFRSFKSGKLIPSENPETIADGLLTSLGSFTFPIILNHVADIVTVTEANIIRAMRLIWERMKIIIEPSAAVPFGCILQYPDKFRGFKIGIILTGGNVDLELFFSL